MFGNLFSGESKQPNKINDRESSAPDKVEESDEDIKKEIDEIEEDYMNEQETDINIEMTQMVSETREKARISENLMIEIVKFARKYQSEGIESMPLEDFIDEINEEDTDFDSEARAQLNLWINRYEDEINFSKPVSAFLVYLSGENKKCKELLNPGPEESEENEE